MTKLSNSLHAWGTPEFARVLKIELEQLDSTALPLQRALKSGSYVLDEPFTVMIISAASGGDMLAARAGVFYSGVLSGCNCADDPTPVEAQPEYCEIEILIDKQTANARFALVDGA